MVAALTPRRTGCVCVCVCACLSVCLCVRVDWGLVVCGDVVPLMLLTLSVIFRCLCVCMWV